MSYKDKFNMTMLIIFQIVAIITLFVPDATIIWGTCTVIANIWLAALVNSN